MEASDKAVLEGFKGVTGVAIMGFSLKVVPHLVENKKLGTFLGIVGFIAGAFLLANGIINYPKNVHHVPGP